VSQNSDLFFISSDSIRIVVSLRRCVVKSPSGRESKKKRRRDVETKRRRDLQGAKQGVVVTLRRCVVVSLRAPAGAEQEKTT